MPYKKGSRDYIRKNRIYTLIRTLLMFFLAILVYFTAYRVLQTNKNLFTVMAVLMILPAAKSAVNCIMFLKAGKVSEDFYGEVEGVRGEVPVLYDLIFTTYEKTFQADALLYSKDSVILFSKQDRKVIPLFEKYLKDVLGDGLTLKIYDDRSAFLERVSRMREHFDGQDKKQDTLFDRIKAVVL